MNETGSPKEARKIDKITPNITDSIAETLFITLYTKSEETKRKDPLIVDKIACELVDKIDYDFDKYKNKPATATGVSIRSSHFDNMAKCFIETHPNPVVVLIGCGLDTRLQRLGITAKKAVFYELDVEEVINFRKQLLPPAENEYYITSSMLTTKWMDDLKTKHPDGDFMFIIEGVLMFFNETDNKFVFVELSNRFKGAEIHFDVLSKLASRNTSKHETVSKSNAVFKFGINDDKEIEKWHPRLRHQKTYLFSDFRGWRRVGIFMSMMMSIIPAFKIMSRIITYKIEDN
jgi:O-methyltransferase involved in polyketide biosynthesis